MTGVARINVGDIVHVDKKGRRFYARVESTPDKPRGELEITPLTRETYRTAKATEIIGRYKRMAGSK